MKRWFAFLLAACLALGFAAGTAEPAAGDCSGMWYLVFAEVTIGDLALNPDSSYVMALYSQDTEVPGTWTAENDIVTLAPRDGTATAYRFEGDRLVPEGIEVDFVIRREPGRITDSELNAYAENQALPEGISAEEMAEIILGIYDAAGMDVPEEELFGNFAGVWTNGEGGYLTVWGEDITAAFPVDGEIRTGFYGDPGEWSRDGETLVNADGTAIALADDGSMLCTEASGTYAFTKVFEDAGAAAGTAADGFIGDWTGIGALITDASGVTVFAPIAGYDLTIRDDRIYTVFEGTAADYPYEVTPESGLLTCAAGEDETAAYTIYRDDTLRWALSDSITVVFRRTAREETAAVPESAGALAAETFETVTPSWARGFSIPTVSSMGRPEKRESKSESTITWHYETEEMTCDETCSVLRLDAFADAEEYYRFIRNNLVSGGAYPDFEEKTAEIGGAPVYLLCLPAGTEGNPAETVGFVYAVRENSILVMSLFCAGKAETPLRVTMNDLETVAGLIAFDPAKAPLRKEDGELAISGKGIPAAARAGKTVQFSAVFANPAAVRADKAGALTWSVTDTATGEAPEEITIDAKGVLTVGRDLTAEKTVEVTAASDVFGTKASYTITAGPVVRGLSFSEREAVLYADSDDSATVTVIPEPAYLPGGLVYTVRPASMAEAVPGENGTVTLVALEPGKGTLTVKEPGGKTASMKVSVLQPVESVTLSSSGKAVPGGTVKVAADIKPNNAGDRKVSWELDVGEDIATVNEYGRIRIKGNVPDGTVITVTCTANGAKVPLTETLQIAVESR